MSATATVTGTAHNIRVRQSKNGKFTTFSVQFDTGQYIDVIYFEEVSFSRGDSVKVTGKLNHNKWVTKAGENRQRIRIRAESVEVEEQEEVHDTEEEEAPF